MLFTKYVVVHWIKGSDRQTSSWKVFLQVDNADYHRARCDERVSKIKSASLEQKSVEDGNSLGCQQLPHNDDKGLKAYPNDSEYDVKALEDENQHLKRDIQSLKHALEIQRQSEED